ncbi:MAG: hypothetical protein ACP5P3_05925 [Ignavibacteria bacterium]
MRKLIFIFTFLTIFVSFSRSQDVVSIKPQDEVDSCEIDWTVPELMKFHDVIYIIWHEAWPQKNTVQLVSLVPEVKEHISKINNANLPGIQRDKEAKWKAGLVEFNKAAENYYEACSSGDAQKMLDAAEDLHAKFEMMVRILKPVFKEVDDYHKILYIIYHKYLPEKKYESIKNVIDNLISYAESIVNISSNKLQKRLKEKSDNFKKAAENLLISTKELKSVLETNDPQKIDRAVEHMHSMYQLLETNFD